MNPLQLCIYTYIVNILLYSFMAFSVLLQYTRLTELDESLMSLAKIRSEKLCKRRQDDIRDEASDCASISRAS